MAVHCSLFIDGVALELCNCHGAYPFVLLCNKQWKGASINYAKFVAIILLLKQDHEEFNFQ